MKKTIACSRRDFLKTALAGAAGVAAFPAIIPARVLGANAPSRKIQMGFIGVGSMGSGDLRAFLGIDDVRLVAVCDVDARHRDSAVKVVNGKYGDNACRGYNDFRELLARGDVDAVGMALPDHWHAIPAIAALRAGCDVYGQKPLARSIREGRAISDAVKRYGRIWQMGSWQRSVENFHHACELVRNGRIGKVTRIEVGLPSGGSSQHNENPPPCAPPEGVDWDRWLGPAPQKPFCNFGGRAPHFNWRWIMDYSGGQLTDWAGHHIDIAHWAMGLDHTGPVEIVGKGHYPEDGVYNTPYEYAFDCRYANGLIINVSSQPPRGTKWIGDKGWIHVTRGSTEAGFPGVLREVIGAEEDRLYYSRDHHRNFIDCVKTRRPTITPAETGLRSISVGLLGEIAMLTGRKIRWNPETEEIIGDPGASALLGRSYREPWTLEG